MSAGGFASPVEVVLEEVASDIDLVVIEGSKGHLREFYEHKATNSFGKFFDRKDIEKKAPGFTSELVRTVPGATLSVSERHGNRILLRGCQPTVWIDGTRAMGAEVDELARPAPARPRGMEGVGPVAAAGQVSRNRVPDRVHGGGARVANARLTRNEVALG